MYIYDYELGDETAPKLKLDNDYWIVFKIINYYKNVIDNSIQIYGQTRNLKKFYFSISDNEVYSCMINLNLNYINNFNYVVNFDEKKQIKKLLLLNGEKTQVLI